MKKISAVLVLLIILLVPVSAQRNKDVIYLKNGSSIYGKLLEVNDSQYKIKTADGSVFIFPSADVDKFVNETIQYEGRKKKGFGIAMEAGFLIGPQSAEYKTPFSFNLLANYTLDTRNVFGFGSGVEYLGEPFTPLFLEYKYFFSQNKTVPFIYVRGGKMCYLGGESNDDYYTPAYDQSRSYSGEGTFTIGTGISWAREYGETYLSFAYRNAHTSYTETNYNSQTVTYKNNYNRLEIKLGFRF
jgi:hypothetical protein